MKKIFRNLKFGLALCAGMLAASCSEVDGTMDEIPYTRVLTPLNFEAEVVASAGTDVRFSWSNVSNAESYILEVFEAVVTTDTDETGKEIEVISAPDYDNTLPAYTEELTNDEIPYTMKDLEVDKSFYARVRAVSSRIESSHWSYLTDYVTTSAVRASLNPFVIERTASTVTIGWEAAEDKEDLTSVRYEPVVAVEGATPVVMALSESEKNACKVLVENLPACVNYKFTLLFGKSGGRGVVTAWTRPDTEGTTRIESSEALYNALNGATGELKLLLAYNDGVAYDLKPYLTTGAGTPEEAVVSMPLTQSVYLYGESSAKGQKPVLMNFQFELSGDNCAAVHMEDLYLDGGKHFGYIISVDKNGKATLPASVEFVNCEIANFTKGLFTISNDGTEIKGKCEKLLIDNVYAHDINATGSGGGDFIDARKGAFGSVELKNSTFYACARSFVRFSETTCSLENLNVSNCTFNQVTATNTNSNNSGLFHIRYTPTSKPDACQPLASFNLTNCVFLNMGNAAEKYSADGKQYWCRMTRQSAENFAPVCAGNIYYNVGHAFPEIVSEECHSSFFYNLKSLNVNGEVMTEKLALADGGMMLEEDPCTNSIAGKMYLSNGVISANRAGDPRWWNAAEPVIVRPTELVTVAEPTVWDFTEKTKFDTETVETNQIIENIRIYAPAEIVMGEGVTFASAATVDSKGVPQNNALQFRAQGVGAVEVTTLDGGVNSSVQVVVGADRYVLLADGETHKVVLGDLVGENDIYVLAGSAVTVTKVAWTDDLTPETTVETLAAPKVTLDASSLDQGSEQAVTASWAAVENAASYEVTFNGKKSEVTEPAFTVDAATVAGLMVGEYEISVVAKPVSTSTKYAASQAGTATLKIKKVIVGGQVSLTWNFDDEAFDEAAAQIGTSDNKAADANFSGLHIESLGGTMKIENRAEGRFLRTGGGGKLTSRRVSFVVPKDGPGTLKVIGGNPSGSTTDETVLTITANINETTILTGELVGKGIKEVTVFDGQELKAGDIVYIYTSGGIRYKQFEYTYIDPNAGPVEKELVWDFTDAGFDTIADAIKSDGSLTGNQQFEWNGLSFWMGGKTKYGTTTINDMTLRFIQWGGKGKSGERSCYFTAPGPGTLTVMASNTGNSEDAARMVTVNVNGVETSQIGGTPANAPTIVTFDLDSVEAGTKVEVYPTGNGLRFFSVKYTYFE